METLFDLIEVLLVLSFSLIFGFMQLYVQLCKERGITPNALSHISAVPQATVKSIGFQSIRPLFVVPVYTERRHAGIMK